MEKLAQLEASVTKLEADEYAQFRDWFWQHENERWDAQLEKDIDENKLSALAAKAIEDFENGKYKLL